MKTKLTLIKRAALLVSLSTFTTFYVAQPSTALAQGTAFTYQGQLQNNGSPASGTYNLTFTLFNTNTSGVAIAGPVTNTAVNVTNGLFTTMVNFGNAFAGASNWLEIGVSTNGANAFITLLPRQQVTPTPYAITAENVVGLTVQENTNGSPNVIGGSSVNYVSNSVYGATIAGGGTANYSNSVTADFGTVGGGGANTASGWASTVGGGFGNTASSPDGSATVGGGYYNTASGNSATVGGGDFNTASGYYATEGGGYDNTIYGNAPYSMIGGGLYNQIYGDTNDYGTSVIVGGYVGTINSNSWNSFIGGGGGNTIGNSIGTTSDHSVIVGGNGNLATGSGVFIGGGGYDGTTYSGNQAIGNASAIVGGLGNIIASGGLYAFIGGGLSNTVSGYAATVSGGFDNTANNNYSTASGGSANTASGADATVPGGSANTAAGIDSFAAGSGAQALHNSCFVWSDGTSFFSSTAADQFLIRAMGGVGINTGSPGAALEVQTTNANGNEIRFGYYTGGAGNLIAGPSYVGIATGDLVTRLAIRQSTGNVGIGTLLPDALLSVNGTADKPGGGSWTTFSDGRLKDIGANFTHGLEALNGIQPVHYHYKTANPLNLPSQPEFVGVVAQQVQQAVPEAVQRSENGYLTVNNDPIIWTMVNAIKELNQKRETEAKEKDAEIQELKQRLEALEKIVLAQKSN